MPKKAAMKKSATTVYLEPEQAEALRRLSDATRVTQANYIREAIDDLLKKYARELKRSERK